MPVLSIDRSENVATPFVAVERHRPRQRSGAGVGADRDATVALLDVTVFPPASWIVATTTAGLIAEPATTAVGCWVYTTLVAAPGVTLNAVLVAVVSPGGGGGERVAGAGLVDLAAGERDDAGGGGLGVGGAGQHRRLRLPVAGVIANVTLAELVVTVFPDASWIATFGWVVHADSPRPAIGLLRERHLRRRSRGHVHCGGAGLGGIGRVVHGDGLARHRLEGHAVGERVGAVVSGTKV